MKEVQNNISVAQLPAIFGTWIDPISSKRIWQEWKNYFKEAAETIAAEMEEKGTSDFSQQVKVDVFAAKL